MRIEAELTIEIPEGSTVVFIDGQLNMYFVNKDEISKQSSYSTPIKQSLKQWQTIDDIETIIRQLDSSSARKQKVFVYTLENGDVKQVESVLRNLFQGSNVRTTGNQEVDPLTTRASSNTQATGSNITLGTRGVR